MKREEKDKYDIRIRNMLLIKNSIVLFPFPFPFSSPFPFPCPTHPD